MTMAGGGGGGGGAVQKVRLCAFHSLPCPVLPSQDESPGQFHHPPRVRLGLPLLGLALLGLALLGLALLGLALLGLALLGLALLGAARLDQLDLTNPSPGM